MENTNLFAILHFCRACMNTVDNLAIRFSDVRVLAQLCNVPGPHTPAQLAMQLNVSRPMISATISRMVAAGIIVRVPSPDDGRSVCLMPTKLGRKTMQQINNNIQALQQQLASVMGQKKFDTLMRLIESANLVMGNNQMK